jgi:hypothetical protein
MCCGQKRQALKNASWQTPANPTERPRRPERPPEAPRAERAGAQPQPSSPTRSLLDGPWRDAPPEALPHGHHYYVDDSIRRRSPVASQTRA